jgi:hypothetical protein
MRYGIHHTSLTARTCSVHAGDGGVDGGNGAGRDVVAEISCRGWRKGRVVENQRDLAVPRADRRAVQVLPVSRLAVQTPHQFHSGVRHFGKQADEFANAKRRAPRGTRGGPGQGRQEVVLGRRPADDDPAPPGAAKNGRSRRRPAVGDPAQLLHSVLVRDLGVAPRLVRDAREDERVRLALRGRTTDLFAAVLNVLLIRLAVVHGAERGKDGHIDGKRDSVAEVCGGESELEQAYSRVFQLDFPQHVLFTSDAQQIEAKSSVFLGRQAKSTHVGQHALDGARAVVGARAAVGVLAAGCTVAARDAAARSIAARTAAARAAAARAAAARAAAIGAVVAAASASATGADEARTAESGPNGGCEAGGRRPAGAGEAPESVHVRAAEAVRVADAL